MRQIISTLVFATFLTACGSVAASNGTVSGPLVENRSYDRIEQLRAARSTAQQFDAWDRIEQLRLQRWAAPAEGISRLRLLDEMFNPTTVAGSGSTSGLK